MENRFGIMKAKSRKKCSHWMCNNLASIIIGDVKQPYSPLNFCLCDKHANELCEKLNEMFVKAGETTHKTVETSVKSSGTHTDESKSPLVGIANILYSSSGKISKADIIKLCEEMDIKLPENSNEMKIRELLEALLPELKTEPTAEVTDNV